jgi:hypothetical protein
MRLQLFSFVIMGCLPHPGNPFLGQFGGLQGGFKKAWQPT